MRRYASRRCAKALVLLHSGSVEAHSEGQGKGSRFTVRLPAQ
jgi:signal transduction histidine kinase